VTTSVIGDDGVLHSMLGLSESNMVRWENAGKVLKKMEILWDFMGIPPDKMEVAGKIIG
jgi:hypothetical protein